jgi:hypothetical protein
MSPLDRLVAQHVAARTTFTLGAATEKIAEELANEILKSEDFRQGFKAMVTAHSKALFGHLLRPERRRRRKKRGRR